MEFFKTGLNYDFMKASKFWIWVSIVLTSVSLILIFTKGFDSGIDFKGGTKVIAEFKRDAKVDRSDVKKVVDELVASKTGEKGTQVEVQDFDVGAAAGADTQKLQIFTELPSLLTPIKKLELAKQIEQHFGAGTMVETPNDAGDKFYVSLPREWPILDGKKELQAVFGKAGHPNIAIESDKEDRIQSDYLREKDLLMSARDDEVKAEAMKVEKDARAKIDAIVDTRFTVEVQAIKDQVTTALTEKFGDGFVQVLSTASVSPAVGKELFQNALLAMIYAIIGILIYIALRFDARYAPGAIVCLLHDVIVVFGVMSVLDIKFTLPIVAAILTVIGYDINDTIVVYDRIRENQQKGKTGDVTKIINLSLNEVLSRTVMTGISTLMTVGAIWLLGGGTIEDFAFLLFIGILLGTYSSIFVASPLVVYTDKLFRRRAAAARA